MQNPLQHNLFYLTAGPPESLEAQPAIRDSRTPRVYLGPTCYTRQLGLKNYSRPDLLYPTAEIQ